MQISGAENISGGRLTFKRALTIGLMAAALLVSFRGCKRHQDVITDRDMSPLLQKDENEKITVDIEAGTVEQTTRRASNAVGTTNPGPTLTRHLDGARKLAITVKKDGSVVVYAQTTGFVFEPGFGLVYDGRLGIAADAQLFFFRRYCLGAGASFTKQGQPRLFVNAAYNIWHNSYILLGIDNKKEIVMGFRVAL